MYGGAFALMHEAVRLYRIAQTVFRRTKLGEGTGRVVLSLLFKAILGIERIFHFETLDDPGFALLTGGKKVMSRSRLGQDVRRVSTRSAEAFMRETAPRLKKAPQHSVSIDEHAIARFTRKFSIPKGFHTIRNKKMKIEKLTYLYDIVSGRLLSLVVSNGKATLSSLVARLMPSLRRKARGAELRVVLDAGAANNHDELLDIALRHNQVTLVRTPRRAAYRKHWEQLPPDCWTHTTEPGPYKDAHPKRIAIAETTTMVRGKKRHKTGLDVRTIVVREATTKGKERWHALWIFGDQQTEPLQLVHEYRARQHHEQTYRIMLHDIHLDTAPSGYNKNSTNPERPGFQQNALMFFGWIAALATNMLLAFSLLLPDKFHRAQPRTLRRWFLFTPAEIYAGRNTLIVLLRPKRFIRTWEALVRQVNRRQTRIPWMEDRLLILSLASSRSVRIPEIPSDPSG